MKTRKHLVTWIVAVTCISLTQVSADQPGRPNVVIILTDDLGYGDLGCFGSATIRTPRLDRLAAEGTKFTSFYAQVTCGPSRSALLTGRYPVRSGGWSMPSTEITLGTLLQQAGYRTCCIGKWDVSNRAEIIDRMPNAHGFERYWGTLGANDNGHVIFHENNKAVDHTADMAGLTSRYTDHAIDFIRQHSDEPFFVFLSHTMVHSVIDASPEFKGRSDGGLYGDAIEELDHHTGRLFDVLDELKLAENTLVVFTSDNGPWNNHQDALRNLHDGAVAWGSSGPLREGKGSTFEGGLRVPCLVCWSGRVPQGRTSDAIFSTLDFLPTFATLSGYEVPTDRIIDGVDQTELLLGTSEDGSRDEFLYFCLNELQAVRKGGWKLMLPDRQKFYPFVRDRGPAEPALYNLESDIGESTNVAQLHPDIVRNLLSDIENFVWPDTLIEPRIVLPKSSTPRK